VKVVENDLLDYEPLVMNFVSSKTITNSQSKQIQSFIVAWFETVVADNPKEWCAAKEWTANKSAENTITVTCDLMPSQAVEVLAAEVERAFPEFIELHIGNSTAEGLPKIEFDWVDVPSGQVSICSQVKTVEAFRISFTAVTLGQFEEFINSTKYQPIADRLRNQQGFLIDHFVLNNGKNRNQPLFGVAHDDATAFCSWANLHLPSEAELTRFFEWTVSENREHRWTGECWTSTPCGDSIFVASDGPYSSIALEWPEHRTRKELHRNQFESPDAPCFRVVKRSAS